MLTTATFMLTVGLLWWILNGWLTHRSLKALNDCKARIRKSIEESEDREAELHKLKIEHEGWRIQAEMYKVWAEQQVLKIKEENTQREVALLALYHRALPVMPKNKN